MIVFIDDYTQPAMARPAMAQPAMVQPAMHLVAAQHVCGWRRRRRRNWAA